MILTDEEIWKNDNIMAANSGYGANFETLRELVRAIESELLEKLRGGVELPEAIAFCDDKIVKGGVGSFARKDAKAYWAKGDFVDRARAETLKHPLCTIESALQYGAAQRLAGREQAIDECAAECLVLHANGNYKHDTREDCHDAIRALAASPQEQT